jgi:hypothetical protein
MARDSFSGVSQQPGDYDGSRISPEIRARLGDLTPELAAGIRKQADATPDQGRRDDRADWRQPRK